MKKYILIVAVILIASNLYSQDKEPQALYFKMPSSNAIDTFNVSNYPQTNFMLGWQWGGHPRMTEALKMNTNENWDDTKYYGRNRSSIPINYIWEADGAHMSSACFIYKPTLQKIF
jgi:hypothetical protein